MDNAVPLGIIDSLSEGFATVNRRLWVLLLPILLDLLLLSGPGISVNALVSRALVAVEQSSKVEGSGTGTPVPADTAESTEQLRTIIQSFQDTNLMGLLAWQVPSVVGATATSPLPKIRGPVITEPGGALPLVGQAFGLAVLSLLGGSFYLAGLAGGVRREAFRLGQWATLAVRGWVSFLALYAGITLAALPLTAVGVGLALVLGALSPGLGSLVSGVIGAAVITLAFYLYFTDDALFLSGVWPLRAMKMSAGLVARNFGQTMGLFLLANLILVGLPLAMRLVVEHPAGLVAAALGHAYVASGVTAGGMVFFYQRLAVQPKPADPVAV
ncbi:MAG: hypothetical protein EXR51_08720 [Dehalococcoidia bacterium]|nr:hypothetical protein [Dehalococcoidia bacterium]